MDWDGKVGSPTLVCHASGQGLLPGQVVYSGLRLHQGSFVRLDFCEAAWPAVDHGTLLSWWRRTLPPATARRTLKLDAAVLGQLFDDLKGATDRPTQCFCYLVALCLVRIRRLRLRTIETRADGPWLLLEERPSGTMQRLRDPRMDALEEERVRQNLMAVVSVEGPPKGSATAPAPRTG
jgi:hypothetical protein